MVGREILNLRPFQETLHRGMCGAASLLIVLDYYDIKKSEQELARILDIDSEMGADSANIKRIAESFGLRVEIENESTFEDIDKWLEKKVPVIVDWFSRGRNDYSESEVADGHYSVVAGLDEKYIHLQDPEIGKVRKIAREDFLRVWFDFEGEYIKPEELIVRQLIAIYL
ncbi:MAG: cysteine peptidase family C39 domain-containing protein [Candidatus Pacebacteria bacterium]|nr:cysteine peptidase family C39 domain-containing protein [Candidatus Paceibacterota bacterium]